MKLRKATKADARALKALDTIVPLNANRAEQIDEWLGRDEVLVAEINGQIVGYGVFNHAFFRQGNVDMLMLHPDYRGQKIGEQLLRELERLCDTLKTLGNDQHVQSPYATSFAAFGLRTSGLHS